MSRQKELVKNTLIIAVGKLSTQFLTFLLLPLYTTLLTPGDYGQLDLALVYLGLLTPTLTVQMEMAVFRHLIDARKKPSDRVAIVSSSFFVTLIGTLVGSTLITAIGWIFTIPIAPYVAGAFAAIATANYFLQVSRGIGRNDIFAAGSIIIGLTNICLSVVSLTVFHASVEGLLIALMTANVVGSAFLIGKTGSHRYLAIKGAEANTIKSLIAYSWPLVPNHISLWGINGISRTVVAVVLGLSATGVYAAASKFTLIYTSLYSIFAMSWTETVSLHLEKRDEFLSNATNSMVKVFSSLALLVIAASAVFFPILVANDFNEAKYYIPLLVIGGFFASMVTHYGAIYLAARETKKIAAVTLQAVIVSTILSLSGIWTIGLYAPALAILVTYAYIAARRHFDVQRFVVIKYRVSTFIPVSLVALIVLILYYIDNATFNILSFALASIAVIFINRADIGKVKNMIRKKGHV